MEVERHQEEERGQDLRTPDDAGHGLSVDRVGREEQAGDDGQGPIAQERIDEENDEDADRSMQQDVDDVEGRAGKTGQHDIQGIGGDRERAIQVRLAAVEDVPVIGDEDPPKALAAEDAGVALDQLIIEGELAGDAVEVDEDGNDPHQ